MRRCEEDPGRRFDWRSWLALGWVAVFGLLYARMVLRERAPGAWEAIEGFGRAVRGMVDG